MKNECVSCGDVWNVKPSRWVKLDSTDRSNLSLYGQLYSRCEDCGEGESVDYADYLFREEEFGEEVWK